MRRIYLGQTDLDGTGFVPLLQYLGFHYDDIMICDYDIFNQEDVLGYVSRFDEVFFVDFSPEEFFMQRLVEAGKIVHVYDHHFNESRQYLNTYAEHPQCTIHVEEDNCGTRLWFQHYAKPHLKRYKPIVDTYVDLIWTYDTWRKDDALWDEAVSLNRVFYKQRDYDAPTELAKSLPFVHSQVKKMQMLDEWRWTEAEKRFIESARAREQQVLDDTRKKTQIRVDHRGHTFGLAPIPSKISLTCNALLEENPNLDYFVAVNTFGGMNGKLSFRSRDEKFNCNDIGVANGHNAAAGAHVDVDQCMRLLQEEPLLCFTYNDEFDEEHPRETVFATCKETTIATPYTTT